MRTHAPNSGLRRLGSALTPEQERRLADARAAWGGGGPEEMLFARVFWSCALCGAGLGNEASWPRNLHPCACGGWHYVCLGCFVARCAEPGANPYYGRCEPCPDAVRVGEAVMGWR